MSSCPGRTLEDFLRWSLDIKVEDTLDANASLGIAEALGTAIRPRLTLTQEQFAKVLVVFEEHRENVEYLLDDFDEENRSWRDYASHNFDFIPGYLYDQAHTLIEEMKHGN